MRTNAVMTVWRADVDPDTRNVRYDRIVVDPVHWFARTAATPGKDGLTPSSTVTIRIPLPCAVDAVRPGDIVARGIVGAATPSGAESVFTVVDATLNTGGTSPHWKVIAR